jgi:hypothetical protein
MRAAEERLDVVGTYVNPITKEHDLNALSDIVKVRVTLKNPLGSRENPVEDYATSWNEVVPKLKEAGYDGIIYRNVQEDEGSISVCVFYRSSIEVAE